MHCIDVGDHSGVPVIYHMKMKQLFAWKGMEYDVYHFVQACQQAKFDRSSAFTSALR